MPMQYGFWQYKTFNTAILPYKIMMLVSSYIGKLELTLRGSHSHMIVEPFAAGIKMKSRDQDVNLY